MAERTFRFVSPGVFINEIDESEIPRAAAAIGPTVIGRSRKGPAFLPTRIESFSDFVNLYGQPEPGATENDVSRGYKNTGPTYGAYAVKAHLAAAQNSGVPVNFVRVLGKENPNATTAGKAGWNIPDGDATGTGGAFGLYMFQSSSAAVAADGTLAAIFYCSGSYPVIRGRVLSTGSAGVITASSGLLLEPEGASSKHLTKVEIYKGGTGRVNQDTLLDSAEFDFDRTSANFARKKFNTNPELTNDALYSSSDLKYYWLGETFEDAVASIVGTGAQTGTDKTHSVILRMKSGSMGYHDFRKEHSDAETGWFISQDTGPRANYAPQDMQKLFKLVGLRNGESVQKDIVISIERIKKSVSDADPYGSFSVVVRDAKIPPRPLTSTGVIERYDNLNLNPASPNFIAKRIGDMTYTYDYSRKVWTASGEYHNNSPYIRVELNDSVRQGTLANKESLPFGVFGPPVQRDSAQFQYKGTSHDQDVAEKAKLADLVINAAANTLPGAPDVGGFPGIATFPFMVGGLLIDGNERACPFTGSIKFPTVPLRVNALDGKNRFRPRRPTDAYFGAVQYGADGKALQGISDYLSTLPVGLGTDDTTMHPSWVFSLDDIKIDVGEGVYVSGSRKAGTSLTAMSSSYEQVLDAGYDKFMTYLHGGFDGFNITETEPLRNSTMPNGTATVKNSSAYNSLDVAIDTVADAESHDTNLMAMPAVTQRQLAEKLINVCEERGDALAMIDLDGVYFPASEGSAYISPAARRGTVAAARTNMIDREIDSSYGCAYYPWVKVLDTATSRQVWVPPSVAMLGVFANSEAESGAVWFAPAGFNRAGLSDGAAGIPVVATSQHLLSKDRDTLYENRINPIARFTGDTIVAFGQKTLQQKASALDRINVRRLAIFLKKAISVAANTVLFDQNVPATWNRFIAAVNPILGSAQAGLGITDYKLILDETTTTPDLIDQNILYAKVLVKPARAIEFIAIDFVIASSGASFAD